MLHRVYLIDGESGFSMLEYRYKNSSFQKSATFQEFFNAIAYVVDDIRSNIRENQQTNDLSRILVIEPFTILLHYAAKGNFLVCVVADADDHKDVILQVIESLGRRFWKKYSFEIEKFRMTNITTPFNSFSIEIELLTLNGEIGQNLPKLMVTDSTLTRLQQMQTITSTELQIAQRSTGCIAPSRIAQDMEIQYDEVVNALDRLSNLDLVNNEINLGCLEKDSDCPPPATSAIEFKKESFPRR